MDLENKLALAVAKEMSKWLQANETRTANMIAESMKPLYELMSKAVAPILNQPVPPPPNMPPVPRIEDLTQPFRGTAELMIGRVDGDKFAVNVLYSDFSVKELVAALNQWLGEN